MAGGTAVQVYAEDILAEMVQARFDEMFESTWWEQNMITKTDALGANGEVSIDVGADWGLKKFTDIKHVYYKEEYYPLKLVPGRTNPARYARAEVTPRYIAPIAGDKIFQVLPYGIVGENITAQFRVRPDTFTADDEVPMDDQAMIYGACYDYLADDGANPPATEKMRNFYNERLEQLNASRNEQDIALMPARKGIDEWHEHW